MPDRIERHSFTAASRGDQQRACDREAHKVQEPILCVAPCPRARAANGHAAPSRQDHQGARLAAGWPGSPLSLSQIAFAVWRLITSSKRSGCSIFGSAGGEAKRLFSAQLAKSNTCSPPGSRPTLSIPSDHDHCQTRWRSVPADETHNAHLTSPRACGEGCCVALEILVRSWS